jgi:O-antigen/teichoic acid export membrane protein
MDRQLRRICDYRVIPKVLKEHSHNGATAKGQSFAVAAALKHIWSLCNPVRALKAIQGNRRLMTEMFGVGWGQVAAAAGGICGVRILTGLLSPAAYGELALVLTASTLAQLAILAPVAASAQRFLAASRESHETHAFLQALAWLFVGATAAVAALGGVGGLLLSHLAPGWLRLMAAAVLLSWLAGTSSILDAIQNAARERNIVAWHQALGQWLRALLPLGFAAVYTTSSAMAMCAYCLAAALVLASQLTFFWRTIITRAPWRPPGKAAVRQKVIQFWGYSWPFATWGLFAWAQSASDRWALDVFRQRADVGIYQVLYQVGYSPIILITGYITWLASPILFAKVGHGDVNDLSRVWSILKRIIGISLGGTLMFALAAACCGRVVLSLLASHAYRSGAHLLPLLVLSAGLFATGQFATLQLMCGSRTSVMVAPKLVTAVLGIGANFLGSYCWGPFGVVAAGTLTSAVYFLWVVWLARMQVRGRNILPRFDFKAVEHF